MQSLFQTAPKELSIPSPGQVDAEPAELGQFAYRAFVRALLSVTDNRISNRVVRPERTLTDELPDTYLVIAADKGTARFSDLGNQEAADSEFWLGDAFASGGKYGFDHKKMGITAKGAWRSVLRHFSELGLSQDEPEVKVIGIGDMSGDVFGNGVILSSKLSLIAAFSHKEIFIDPNPNPERAYRERLRLFQLPGSSWSDYNPKLISGGGGVYSRKLKSINLSPEAMEVLEITSSKLTPDQLVAAILKAPAELLWNGGIGTFVKGSNEQDASIGDPGNDRIRAVAHDLKVKVVGEGGNLGLTQAARVEFARRGGLVFTDSIDNAGGVHCSDLEVNIKILLQRAIDVGSFNVKQRNSLLKDLIQEVEVKVLEENSAQALALSLEAEAAKSFPVQSYLELSQRASSMGIFETSEVFKGEAVDSHPTRPQLSLLIGAIKLLWREEISRITNPDLPQQEILEDYFPASLHELLRTCDHPLKLDITATKFTNSLVNTLGVFWSFELLRGGGVGGLAHIWRLIKTLDTMNLFRASGDFSGYLEIKPEMIHWQRHLGLCCIWLATTSNNSRNLKSKINSELSGLQPEDLSLPGQNHPLYSAEVAKKLSSYMSGISARLVGSCFPRRESQVLAEFVQIFFELLETAYRLPATSSYESSLLSGLRNDLWKVFTEILNSKRFGDNEARQKLFEQIGEFTQDHSLPSLLCGIREMERFANPEV